MQRIETITTDKTLPRGAVLGLIKETGSYALSKKEATDGSQVPVAILAERVDKPANTDNTTQAVVYHSGEFNNHALTFGKGMDAVTLWTVSRTTGNNSLFFRDNQEA